MAERKFEFTPRMQKIATQQCEQYLHRKPTAAEMKKIEARFKRDCIRDSAPNGAIEFRARVALGIEGDKSAYP